MAEHIIFHDCSDGAKQATNEAWARLRQRLEKLLTHFPEDQRHLRLTLRDHAGRFEATAVLNLPTGTLIARGESDNHDCVAALGLVADRLFMEISRHRDQLPHATRALVG